MHGRFPQSAVSAYLDTAAEGLPPAESAAALQQYFLHKSSGSPGRAAIYEMQRLTEASVAQLMGASPDSVTLLANASDALNLLANSIPWHAGDEVVLIDLEFPSNVLAWLRLKHFGVNVRVITTTNGIVRLEDFTAHMNNRTRLVSVSAVSYKTGTRIPFLPEIARAAHARGAYFCVDATQALGRVPVPLDGVDYLVASSYKWLLGTHGLGITYVSNGLRDAVHPGAVGWYSVEDVFHDQRFETFSWKSGAAGLLAGMPNFPAIFALKSGLDVLLETGVEKIDRSLQPLVADLHRGIARLGLTLLTPSEPEFSSGILSFVHPHPHELALALRQAGVVVWGGDGRVRASVHLYNCENDIARFLDQLRRRASA